MAEGSTFSFSDPDAYAAAFGDTCVDLTITGAGDFKAWLTRRKLKHLEVYRCCENLSRIAYISLPPGSIFLSFPIGNGSSRFGGCALQNGDIVLHGQGERGHQQFNGACEWGLIASPPDQLARYCKTLTERPITLPHARTIFSPSRAERSRFRALFRRACHLAGGGKKSIEHAKMATALEQEMLDAIVNCLSANETKGNSKAKLHHAAVMVRLEETLIKRRDQRLNMSALCAEIGVAERTLRVCCAEFLGVSPMRYLLLRRLNEARSALRCANPSTSTVAEVARNHQFLELGRFAVTYRTTFGESPSVTLHRDPRTPPSSAEFA
jgi:AraC-like DNA-binding protein